MLLGAQGQANTQRLQQPQPQPHARQQSKSQPDNSNVAATTMANAGALSIDEKSQHVQSQCVADDGWVNVQDPQSGQWYWWNESLQQSAWVKPSTEDWGTGNHIPDSYARAQEQQQQKNQQAVSHDISLWLDSLSGSLKDLATVKQNLRHAPGKTWLKCSSPVGASVRRRSLYF
jgi:hypothetical protein